MPKSQLFEQAVEAPNVADSVRIIENETYVITDLVIRDDEGAPMWTLSTTRLFPLRRTRGHSHADQDEVYEFTVGEGTMQVGGGFNDFKDAVIYKVKTGSVVFVPAGKFHRVFNRSKEHSLWFIASFKNGAKRPAFNS